MDLFARAQVLELQARLQKAEARIKELEEEAEAAARTLKVMYTAFERLGEMVERLAAQIKDVEHAAWENSNGYDI